MILHTGETASFAEFQEFCEDKRAMSASEIQTAAHLMQEWIALNAAKGSEVDLGPLGRSRLGMKGSFTEAPDRILDQQVKLTLSWIFPRKLKERVARAGEKLIRQRVNPHSKAPVVQQIKAIDANGQLLPDADTYIPGRFIRIYGARLQFDPTATDEGVFVLRDGQDPLRVSEALRITQQELLVRIPVEVSGDCMLRVVRRHPAKTGELLWGERAIVPVQ